jgi:single-strand DNA-binding protein
MSGVNRVFLIGNLGADPEVRATQSGLFAANFRIATNVRYKDKDGNQREHTEWHRIVTFGKLAEISRDYLRRGRQVFVEGRLQTREWQDKDGHKRYTTEVVVDNLQFLGVSRESSAASPPPAAEAAALPEADVPF